MKESTEQGLKSPSILGFEAVMQQQLDQIYPFEVPHNWYLQEEEDMVQLLAHANECW